MDLFHIKEVWSSVIGEVNRELLVCHRDTCTQNRLVPLLHACKLACKGTTLVGHVVRQISAIFLGKPGATIISSVSVGSCGCRNMLVVAK